MIKRFFLTILCLAAVGFACQPFPVFGDVIGINVDIYRVRPGDTVYGLVGGIVGRIKPFTLLNGVDEQKIYPGMRLRIPRTPADWRQLISYEWLPPDQEQWREYRQVVMIDLSQQILGCYENGRLVRLMAISSGERGRPTPRGRFKSLVKDKAHASASYKDSRGRGIPMPYAVMFKQLYWIHGGRLPGYPDSHGCVRLGGNDARWFFGWIELDTLIAIE